VFKSYLKIALRQFKKHKGYSLINIAGLAVGMACCILILLFVFDELSYDKFHTNHDHIYRVTRKWFNADGVVNLHLGHVAPPIAPLLKNDFPEILHAVRLIGIGRPLIGRSGEFFEEPRFYFVEEDIFRVFTLDMIKGDPDTALKDPFSLVITGEMAEKYFGAEDPMGKSLAIQSGIRKVDMKVTGVFQALPHNSHFHADFLAAFKTYEALAGKREMESWSSNNYATYLLMPEGYDITRLAAQLDPFIDRHMSEGMSERTKLKLQRLTDIHLYSHLDSELEANSDITYVYVFSIIALFVLLIACINFMNLATARSAGRAREVGLRKVVGARRPQLIRQFLAESIITALLSLIGAMALLLLVLPAFNRFVGRELSLDFAGNISLAFILLLVAVFVGLVSGFYPALFLSAFRPARVLKGSLGRGKRGFSFRTALVVFQFATSITLIICVSVVSRQLDYMQSRNPGFEEEHIVILPSSPAITRRLEGFKTRLLADPGVLSVSAAKRVPSGRLLDSSGARVLSGETAEPVNFRVAMLLVDHDYIPTFRMEMAAGRNFSKEMGTDATEAFIINETAASRIGWDSPDEAVGQGFGYAGRKGRIIGVVKDFHFESLHHEISPMVMFVTSSSLNQIAVRIAPQDIPRTMAFLKNIWAEVRPNYPFAYNFLDENFDKLYRSEEKLRQIFGGFAFLAVFIGCLGLFGLASYSAERRTKEIGIRKVLGATESGLAVLLSKEFTKWVLLANLVAWPAAYLVMTWWLKNFAYRSGISLWAFIAAGGLAWGIAFLTVGYQAVKASLADPVKALKYE
jgi:putative ABC transport system permease protein